jgi:hypothetical protein
MKINVILLVLMLFGVSTPEIGQMSSSRGDSYSNAALGFRYFPLSEMKDVTQRARNALGEQGKAAHVKSIPELLLVMASGFDDRSPNWHLLKIESLSRDVFPDADDMRAAAKMNAFVAGSTDLLRSAFKTRPEQCSLASVARRGSQHLSQRPRCRMRTLCFIVLALLLTVSRLTGQDQGHQGMDRSHMNMPQMNMPHMNMEPSHSLIDALQKHSTSGTDAEPESTPSEMLMAAKGSWTFMLHGEAFLNEIQQTGPRGADKLFSTNWFMPMAQRKFGQGMLTLRTMFSLEPATVSERRYPELFQQGETAYGLPIVDGQHPHDFFMELAAIYDYKVGEKTLLSLYVAPVGDPALGPLAYPHRASASEDPIAPLGHHLQDSTHISDDVITVGVMHRLVRLEASGFHGREPDESRWSIQQGELDSWSTRLTVNPTQNWSLQYSIGQLHSPEALQPTEDTRRMTASLMYNRPIHNGNWASMILWGRNQSLSDGNVGNSYLLESTVRFLSRNYAWTRIENVDRTNELLLGETPLPNGFVERYFTRAQAYTVGYDREVGRVRHVSMAIGGQVTLYGVPQILETTYGSHPVGVVAFLRLRQRQRD